MSTGFGWQSTIVPAMNAAPFCANIPDSTSSEYWKSSVQPFT